MALLLEMAEPAYGRDCLDQLHRAGELCDSASDFEQDQLGADVPRRASQHPCLFALSHSALGCRVRSPVGSLLGSVS